MVVVEEARVGQIGLKLRATIYEGSSVVDISTASVKELVFRQPNTTVTAKTATFETDGSNGQIYYLTEAGFLDEPGTWYWQPEITMAGSFLPADIKELKVFENLR